MSQELDMLPEAVQMFSPAASAYCGELAGDYSFRSRCKGHGMESNRTNK